ncbi:Uncharacterised protein [Yersinia intermedia]|jgi:hypothetical protein|nr:hypothetical protein CH53_2565 [Yersinia intermedia]CNI30639.1 Uncharacterised protein [Yersinia intermedia]CNI40038.1 Uncharacterised protein [Yersinia intermedia]CNK40899.1 Uncharacterised protein [Yersinia intermedia]CQD77026.1 Uncharacterised protein [Yersinia intermedia]
MMNVKAKRDIAFKTKVLNYANNLLAHNIPFWTSDNIVVLVTIS